MRVNELCNLGVEDLDVEHGYIHVEVAKGGRPSTVVSPTLTLDALQVHLHGREAGFVFLCSQDGHISTRQVQRLLDKIATRAGLQDERPVLQRSRKRISPHLLRHSAATWWLDAGIHWGRSRAARTCRPFYHPRYVDRAPNHRRESFRRAGVDKMV